MKILDILEARYYGRHTADDVIKRLQELARIADVDDDVNIQDAWKLRSGNVEAKFTVANIRTEQDVETAVKQWLSDVNIPYTQIWYLNDFSTASELFWSVTTIYDPKLTEARYYGRHTPVSVGLRLNKIARTHNAIENVRVLDVYLPSDDVVHTKLYIVNAASGQDAENEVRSFLKKFGIPYTQISDVTSYHDAWEASMKYDPQGLTEAKYYQRPPLKEILKRTRGLTNSTVGSKVWLNHSAIHSLDQGRKELIAKFVVRGPLPKEQVLGRIEQFLETHDIPYTEIYGLTHPDGPHWYASMRYEPTGQVTEAKYYGKHSPEDVKDRLDQTAHKYNKWENVRVLEAWLADRPSRQGDLVITQVKEPFTNPVVFAHLYVVNADSEQDAENEIRLYFKKFGIPFTGIEDLEEYPTPINDRRSAWEATVIYDPGAQSERQ